MYRERAKTPEILYKYRALDINTLSILESGRVWYSRREQLNDPFDCTPDFQIDVPEYEIDKFLEIVGADHLIREMKDIGDNRLDFAMKREIVESTFFNNLNTFGVFCASADPCDELMWAHYGDNHMGICIGFDVNPKNISPASTHLIPRPVDYSGRGRILLSDIMKSERGELDFQAHADDTITNTFYRKNEAWKYEKEWRYISMNENGLIDLDSKIASVTFGLRCNSEKHALVKRFLPNNVQMRKIVMNGSELAMGDFGGACN